jgi:hypothetical protein
MKKIALTFIATSLLWAMALVVVVAIRDEDASTARAASPPAAGATQSGVGPEVGDPHNGALVDMIQFPHFELTPAPAGETVLARWKRTKADWTRASKQVEEIDDQLRDRLTFRAIEPWIRADKDLMAAQCDKLCPPPAAQQIGQSGPTPPGHR